MLRYKAAGELLDGKKEIPIYFPDWTNDMRLRYNLCEYEGELDQGNIPCGWG